MTPPHSILAHWESVQARLAAWGAGMTDGVLLLFRLIWGWGCVRSGYKHLVNFDGAASYFASLHIPYPAAALGLSATAELLGGVMLMLGFGARIACVPLVINFTVAFLTSGRPHVVNLLLLHDADKFIAYPAMPYLMTSVLIFAFGPGRYALDHWIQTVRTARKTGVGARG